MLPPVLEIYVVWHPEDLAGRTAAEQIVAHFHGTNFSGLIGGAIEVFVRTHGWRSEDDAPRPIPLPDSEPPNGVAQAEITAIVPVLSVELARAVEDENNPWYAYISAIATARSANPSRVCVFPLSIHESASNKTKLGQLVGSIQRIAAPDPGAPPEPEAELRCRDLAQSIAQHIDDRRLNIFISHTKHSGPGEEAGVSDLIRRVRVIISQTRLAQFFDANDLQPGSNWDEDLRRGAETGALLAIRTDLYSGREWCQREMLLAKQTGLPVVILDALNRRDERGSFLMDHVPRESIGRTAEGWCDSDIRAGLNMLVDEALKRALWRQQERLARCRPELDVAWWAAHAPEPATLVHFLKKTPKTRDTTAPVVRILHPDPPLGPDERSVLDDIAILAGLSSLDILTPRLLAARGG